MRILSVAIIKGGTGKTATAAAMAQAAAACGEKVLAIDLDPQANLTFSLGADQNKPGADSLFSGSAAAAVTQRTAQGIDVIAGSLDLATVRTAAGSALRLSRAIEGLPYGLVVIDTPPTIGEMTYNALQASTDLLIPLEADTNSLQGLFHIAGIASKIMESNRALRIAGTVLTRYDPRPKLNRHIRAAIEEQAAEAGIPYLAEIRAGISVREAAALQVSLFDYAPHTKPAEDYMRLYKKIMEG